MTSVQDVHFLFCEYNKNIANTLSRKLIQDSIDIIISELAKLNSDNQMYWVSNLILLSLQKRALRLKHGRGERARSYWMIIHLYHYFPKSIYFMLRELPYIGYWGDLKNIYKIVFDDIKNMNPLINPDEIEQSRRLLDNIVDVWCIQMDKDKRYLNKLHPGEVDSVSYMAKWIPKENGSLNKNTKVINHILKKYDPLLWSKNRNKAKKNYRVFVSECNKLLNTTEVLMCKNSFSYIDFSSIPKKCLYKYHNAWLDESENGKRKHPNNIDRNIARDNYLGYINHIEDDIESSQKLSDFKNGEEISVISDMLNDKTYNPYRHLIEHANEVIDYFKKINTHPNYNENYLNNFIKS